MPRVEVCEPQTRRLAVPPVAKGDGARIGAGRLDRGEGSMQGAEEKLVAVRGVGRVNGE